MVGRAWFIGLGLVLLALVSLVGLDSCQRGKGAAQEVIAHIEEGKADAHVSEAQAIPDHAQELAQAKADVAGARAEVERLRRIVAAQGRARVPDPSGPVASDVAPVPPDHRDELLAADAVLIAKQDADIQVLTGALMDERRRSDEFRQAFEAERKATAAQAAATEAWKKAVTTSKWVGRAQGFAAGVALGYVGGRLR